MFKRGSILLVQVLVVSAVMILLVLAASDVTVSTSKQYLNSYSGRDLFYVADGCLEEVISRLEDDTSVSSVSLVIDDVGCDAGISGAGPKDVSMDVTLGDYVQEYSAVLSIVTNGQANNVSLVEFKRL